MKKIFSLFAAVLFAGSMMATDLLNIDFTAGQGEWTVQVVSNPDNLDAIWSQTSQYGMKATAYTSSDKVNHESEAWLISPAIDLSAVEKATLKISHARKFGDLSQLSVKASADGETWAALELSAWPDGSNWNFIDAEADLAAFVGKAGVKIAFVYTSSSSAAATWEIKTVVVGDGKETPVDPEVVHDVPEGVLTCAGAQELAATVADPTADNKNVEVGAVKVRGHVTFAYDASEKDGVVKQSAWIADTKSATAGVVQAYYLEIENLEAAVVKGDYVELEGTLVKYFKAADNIILEVINGTMKKVHPLSIDNVTLTEKAQKVMVDGVVYIVRDNKMFNLQGAQVR